MAGGLTELAENCRMADYRDAMSRAARLLKISRRLEASDPEDAAFLYAEYVSMFHSARRYKEEILLFDSFVPWG